MPAKVNDSSTCVYGEVPRVARRRNCALPRSHLGPRERAEKKPNLERDCLFVDKHYRLNTKLLVLILSTETQYDRQCEPLYDLFH